MKVPKMSKCIKIPLIKAANLHFDCMRFV
uniref:Uncharacterized protein n=1 Tax=Anguilla anguilla TaxID=7936 RepID=A0A0E9QA17_ANGAN